MFKNCILKKYILYFCPILYRILDSIVVSIPACHAGDRGSIPRRGELFVSLYKISTYHDLADINKLIFRLRNQICSVIIMTPDFNVINVGYYVL
jgi:hypothetical protein